MAKGICPSCKKKKELVEGYGRRFCKECYKRIDKQAKEEVERAFEEILKD